MVLIKHVNKKLQFFSSISMTVKIILHGHIITVLETITMSYHDVLLTDISPKCYTEIIPKPLLIQIY